MQWSKTERLCLQFFYDTVSNSDCIVLNDLKRVWKGTCMTLPEGTMKNHEKKTLSDDNLCSSQTLNQVPL